MGTVMAQDWIGKEISEYTIVEVLGEGGMGVVFKGRHNELGTYAAIKLLNLAFISDEVLQRFRGEARILNELRGIPNIADFLQFTTKPYLTLITEFVDGVNFQDHLEQAKDLWAVATQLELFNAVIMMIAALEEAHKRGVIHRDMKRLRDQPLPGGRKRNGAHHSTVVHGYDLVGGA
jgi:serine/threonine-protein kinase